MNDLIDSALSEHVINLGQIYKLDTLILPRVACSSWGDPMIGHYIAKGTLREANIVVTVIPG